MEQTTLDKITLRFDISKPTHSVPRQQKHSLQPLNQINDLYINITSVAHFKLIQLLVHYKTHAVQNTSV